MARPHLFILIALCLLGSAGAGRDVIAVKRGDTLSSVARAHGTTAQHLKRLNNVKADVLRVGQQLRLNPLPAPKLEPARPRAYRRPPAAPTTAASVTVKAGDTLSRLARQHGVSVAQLQRLNGLKSSTIRVGQRLKVSATGAAVPRGPSVRLISGPVLGVPVQVVRVDLRDPSVLVTPLLPIHGLGSGEGFDAMARRSGATAVINGSYFHPQSYVPAGDLVVHGNYVSVGRVPTAVTITPDNLAAIRPVSPLRTAAWRGFETVVASGPYILRAGVVELGAHETAYRDGALFRRAARSAVGLQGGRHLIFMSTRAPITTFEAAKLMRALGAQDAVLLDGGSSTGLAWQGRILIRPARKIAYGIAVYANYKGTRYTR